MDEEQNGQPPEPVAAKTQMSTPLAMAIGALVMVVVVGFVTSVGGSDAKPALPPEPPASEEAPAVIQLPPGEFTSDMAIEAARAQGASPELLAGPKGGLTQEQLDAVNEMAKAMRANKEGRSAAGYASLKATLRGLTSAQEVAFSMNNTYTTDLKTLHFDADPSVTMNVIEATQTGWAAEVKRADLKGSCVIFVGQVRGAPRTSGGRMATAQAYPMCDE